MVTVRTSKLKYKTVTKLKVFKSRTKNKCYLLRLAGVNVVNLAINAGGDNLLLNSSSFDVLLIS